MEEINYAFGILPFNSRARRTGQGECQTVEDARTQEQCVITSGQNTCEDHRVHKRPRNARTCLLEDDREG